jgi:hypothetical protein
MKQAIRFPAFRIECDANWTDITDTLDTIEKPFTLVRQHGVGALQISPALYRGGMLPSPTKDILASMAIEFGQMQALGEPFDVDTFEGSLAGGAASYHSESDFIRVWYLSDGRNIMLATFVCEWDVRDRELTECEVIIRSLQFDFDR